MPLGPYPFSSPRFWDYNFNGWTSNLSGCLLSEEIRDRSAFLAPVYEVVWKDRSDTRKDSLIVIFQSRRPPIALVLEIRIPLHAAVTNSSWSASTAQNTLNAWLVRMPAGKFADELAFSPGRRSPFSVIDEESIMQITHGRHHDPATTMVTQGLAIPLKGSAEVELGGRLVQKLSLDLTSIAPVKPYSEYLDYTVRLLSQSPNADEEPARTLIMQAKNCLLHPPGAQKAVVKGVFTGEWRR